MLFVRDHVKKGGRGEKERKQASRDVSTVRLIRDLSAIDMSRTANDDLLPLQHMLLYFTNTFSVNGELR